MKWLNRISDRGSASWLPSAPNSSHATACSGVDLFPYLEETHKQMLACDAWSAGGSCSAYTPAVPLSDLGVTELQMRQVSLRASSEHSPITGKGKTPHTSLKSITRLDKRGYSEGPVSAAVGQSSAPCVGKLHISPNWSTLFIPCYCTCCNLNFLENMSPIAEIVQSLKLPTMLLT